MIRDNSTAKLGALAVVVIVAAVAFVSMNSGYAEARLLFESSLNDGDYGVGTAIDTMDSDHGGSPHVLGIVDRPDGVTFTSTESNSQSNALINWYIAEPSNRSQFCMHGTISFMFKADRETHVSGEILGDNYGFDAFRHGQGAISARANRVENGPGSGDDYVNISWATTDGYNPWVWHGPITLEYDRWYHLGFAWGGPENTHETWVCSELITADSEGPIPWGVSWGTGSATNIGLGDNHERGVSGYNSAAGVTFANIRIWDEYRAQGDTRVCPSSGETSPSPTPVLAPNLTLAKSAAPSTIEAGETTTITIRIENEGKGDAKAVKVTDTLTRGFTIINGSKSATFGEIQSGNYRTFEYTLKATGSGKFTSDPATATYTDADGNSYAATSNSVSIQVVGGEDVSVSVDSDGDGWSDEKEKEMGTNPYSIDSDNDGLKDPEDPNPTVPNGKRIPGFEGIFALTGLLAAVFFVLMLRKRS